ncbi:MAG: hypothetical protein ABGY29_01170 [bacterium]
MKNTVVGNAPKFSRDVDPMVLWINGYCAEIKEAVHVLPQKHAPMRVVKLFGRIGIEMRSVENLVRHWASERAGVVESLPHIGPKSLLAQSDANFPICVPVRGRSPVASPRRLYSGEDRRDFSRLA